MKDNMKQFIFTWMMGGLLFGCTAITPDVDVVEDDSFDSAQETGSDDSDSAEDTEGGFDSAQPGDSESGGDLDSDGDTDTAVDTDTNADSDTVADTDSNDDSDTDTDTVTDTDTGTNADTDSEADSDSGGDSDSDTVIQPTITGIEGTGAASAINPLAADQATYDSYAGNRTDANNRISSVERELVISGTNLEGVTSAQAVGQNSQGTIDFEIVEATMNQLKIKFPNPMTVTAGGLFVLTLATLTTSVDAQVFFLQGEKGDTGNDGADGTVIGMTCTADTCTLDRSLKVAGNLTAASQDCPFGYDRNMSKTDIVLCEKVGSPGIIDEVVKVGDFWIDRYEASVWEDQACSTGQKGLAAYDADTYGFSSNGNWASPLYSCSIADVEPAQNVTWFQAQQACALQNKQLCSNAQWQAATAGTHDPGSADGSGGNCNTNLGAPRNTGESDPYANQGCASVWGAEDMIGNLWEWTSNWHVTGTPWMTDDGQRACQSGCTVTGGWGAEYENDMTFALNGNAYYDNGYHDGVPAASVRGGDFYFADQSGSFAFRLNSAPSRSLYNIGFRCCISQ
jgi:formylglycine-generating enzyme required for sulfatase activity